VHHHEGRLLLLVLVVLDVLSEAAVGVCMPTVPHRFTHAQWRVHVYVYIEHKHVHRVCIVYSAQCTETPLYGLSQYRTGMRGLLIIPYLPTALGRRHPQLLQQGTQLAVVCCVMGNNVRSPLPSHLD
jgi:hypothetical protein